MQRTLAGRSIQPGVDLGDVGGRGPAALRGRLPQGPLGFRRAKLAIRFGLERRRLAGGLQFEAVQAGFELELAGEGFALVGAGPQALHFLAVLVGLVAVRIDAGGRRPRLGRRGGGEGEQGQGGNDQPGHG